LPDKDKSQRTEPPTPKRIREAREKGNIAKSREPGSVFILISSMIIFYFHGKRFLHHLFMLMQWLLGSCGEISLREANPVSLVFQIEMKLVPVLLPVILFVGTFAFLANYCQIGFLLTLEPLKPNFEKINPIQGFQKFFSLKSLVELIKSLFKIGIIGLIAYVTIRGELTNLPLVTTMTTGNIFLYICRVAFKILFRATLALLIMAALDYAYQRYDWYSSLKMTKEEVKEEWKQLEGDPKVRGKIRSTQQKLARQRMMSQVPQADVVITNPQHLAIALSYVAGEMTAPKVIAKGAGYIAEKIKGIAAEYNIPLVEDKPLAQVLYKTLEIGEMIPPHLYQAVSEILAYVYRLRPEKYRK
jgi:flagellar biosynthetic protein FlhB